MHLYQLVYSSTRNPSCTDAEIQKILASCEKNNPAQNITGVLLHSDNHFIQYLEGDKDIINLYDLIKTDPRHSRVALLSYGPIRERMFPSWHMGYKNLTRAELAFHTSANEDDKKVFRQLIEGDQVTQANAINLLKKFFQKA
jgi:hypothetical protein